MHHNYINQNTMQTIVEGDGAAYQIALAVAVAYSLALPSSPVDNALGYFDDTLRAAATEVIGLYNEVRPVAIGDTVENARAFWNARYEICHGVVTQHIAAGAGLSSCALSVFGIAYSVPAALLKKVEEKADKIQPILAAITANLRNGKTVEAVNEASVAG